MHLISKICLHSDIFLPDSSSLESVAWKMNSMLLPPFHWHEVYFSKSRDFTTFTFPNYRPYFFFWKLSNYLFSICFLYYFEVHDWWSRSTSLCRKLTFKVFIGCSLYTLHPYDPHFIYFKTGILFILLLLFM